MAIEFARVRYVKRSDGGNVCRSAAYNARDDVRSERTGERFYFSHRSGSLHHEVMLPEGAAEGFRDTEVLWNAAQAAEKRKDAQEARELLLALPSNPGLDLNDWRLLAQEFADEHFVAKGVAVQIDIHAPHEGHTNYHAHLLITTRRIEGDRFADRKARDLDPEVRTAKNGKPLVAEGELWGGAWREHQNAYFERQSLAIRVDETGIVAQRHEGPTRLRTVPAEAQARAAANDDLNEQATRDPEQVLAAMTARRATFTEFDIDRQLRKHVPDTTERAALRAEILARPEVVALHERDTGVFAGRFTTQAVRAEEEAVLQNAATLRRAEAVAARHVAAAAANRTLDVEQKAAFLKATGTDGFVMIEGIAGAGKSYSIEAIREAHERDGWRVIGLAPTNGVAEDMRGSGFRHASTVHLELINQDAGRHDRAPAWNRRTCVVVDEAAMLDTKIMGRLMQHAATTKAKVVLVGDDRQLASVERGGMFTELKDRHGSAVIAKVRRQDQAWQRAASEDFADGRVAEGLRAYAEHNCLHWSDDLEEARTRLLSDWDQSTREQPADVKRFVYASTNAEVNRLNQDIREIRVRRGEVGQGITVETTKGTTTIGAGDRIQLFGNDRRAGLFNGMFGTVTAVEGRALAVETDNGRAVRIDTENFNKFGLGYAGTIYRGQGKTQVQVQALYDSAFAWNSRTTYVGMTRHREAAQLYVPTTLAGDELALGRQMSRRTRDEASLTYATKAEAEVIELAAARQQRHATRAPGEAPKTTPQSPPQKPAEAPDVVSGERAQPAPSSPQAPRQAAAEPQQRGRGGRLPQAEIAALRQIDMTVWAREVHGYEVAPHPESVRQYQLTRPAADGGTERLEVLHVPGGHWTFRNPADLLDRGDILDFARREGAVSLTAAWAQVAAYQVGRSEAMQQPQGRRKQAEEEPIRKIDPKDPAVATKRAGAEDERRQNIAKGEEEDQRAAHAETEAKRRVFAREEAERKTRLDAEARQAKEAEQARLQLMQQRRPLHHEAYTAEQGAKAAQARQQLGIAAPNAGETTVSRAAGDADAYPASASLRYAESLGRHYDPQNHYGSMARAGLADSVAWQRDRFELDRKIALEADPARRDMLVLRRDIEHGDHMGQAWERVSAQSRAIGGQAHSAEAQNQTRHAQGFREDARQARKAWEARSVENPSLYPPLNEQMRVRTEAARQAHAQTKVAIAGQANEQVETVTAQSTTAMEGKTNTPAVAEKTDRVTGAPVDQPKTSAAPVQTVDPATDKYTDWTKKASETIQRDGKTADKYTDWTQKTPARAEPEESLSNTKLPKDDHEKSITSSPTRRSTR